MSRKVNVEANVVAILEIPIKLDILIRSDEGANLDKMVQGYFRNGTEHFAKGDIENVTVIEADDEITKAFREEHENDSIQDLIKKKVLKVRLINATVTDSR